MCLILLKHNLFLALPNLHCCCSENFSIPCTFGSDRSDQNKDLSNMKLIFNIVVAFEFILIHYCCHASSKVDDQERQQRLVSIDFDDYVDVANEHTTLQFKLNEPTPPAPGIYKYSFLS